MTYEGATWLKERSVPCGETYRRVIALLVGAGAWMFYFFQEELAKYGLYTLISYRIHELASLIPLVLLAIGVIWGIVLLVKLLKKGGDRTDRWFLALLLALTLLPQGKVWERVTYWDAVATVESVDKGNGTITVRIGEEKLVLLEAPMLVRDMVEVGEQKYLISYETSDDAPGVGTLYMISRVE